MTGTPRRIAARIIAAPVAGFPRSLLVCLVAATPLALAGCETTMDLLDRHAPTEETWLKVDAAGVGKLDGRVAFDPGRILALMPDYTSGNVLISQETQTANALVLFHPSPGGAVQVLQILPHPDGGIAEIHGVSRQVRGPAGERPGMSLVDTPTDPSTCRMGTTLWTGLVVCRSSGARNVLLTFALPGSVPASAMLPTGNDLGSAELQRIIWTRRD